MDYVVIDLEMCNVPKHYRTNNYKYATEIIQIGAVLMDQDYKRVATISQYVHPEHGVIDTFIVNLTGIQNNQIKHAPLLREVLQRMIEWIGDREYQVIAWSDSDYCQLMHEITSKGLENEQLADFMDEGRWIDYQDVFSKRFDFTRAIGLEEALMLCDIDSEGRFHNGLDDAINTAKLIEKLERNPDYQVHNYEKDTDCHSEPISVSMGAIFANLGINCKV